MDARIDRLIRDTAPQLHAVLRQTVIDAMLGDVPTEATPRSVPRRGVGSATQRAVARVAAGESQSAAARAEGINVSGVCRAVTEARRRGEFTAPIRRQGRPVNEAAFRAARFAIDNRMTTRAASIEFGVKLSAVAWHMAKMRKVTP